MREFRLYWSPDRSLEEYMGRFSVAKTIDAPADAVWADLGDPTRAPEWMKTVATVEKTSEGETAKAASFRAASNKRDRHGRTVMVAELEAGRRIALASKSGGLSAVYDYSCESGEEDKTQVTLVATCEGKGFFWAIIQPMPIFMIKSTDRGQFKRLKKLVEAPPPETSEDVADASEQKGAV
jgi:uncharacterized protein YndB with AHSA1/START domain